MLSFLNSFLTYFSESPIDVQSAESLDSPDEAAGKIEPRLSTPLCVRLSPLLYPIPLALCNLDRFKLIFMLSFFPSDRYFGRCGTIW